MQINCFFHLKQAIVKNLKERNISPELIRILTEPNGLFDILVIIPIDEILCKGIPYIRDNMDEGEFKDQFTQFWSYFIKANWGSGPSLGREKDEPQK